MNFFTDNNSFFYVHVPHSYRYEATDALVQAIAKCKTTIIDCQYCLCLHVCIFGASIFLSHYVPKKFRPGDKAIYDGDQQN